MVNDTSKLKLEKKQILKDALLSTGAICFGYLAFTFQSEISLYLSFSCVVWLYLYGLRYLKRQHEAEVGHE